MCSNVLPSAPHDESSLYPQLSPHHFRMQKANEVATATKFFEFIVFAFSESLSGTYSPVKAVLSNKRGKMDFFYGFFRKFFVRHY